MNRVEMQQIRIFLEWQVDVLSGHLCHVSHPNNQEACEQGLKESWGTIGKYKQTGQDE